MSDIWQGYGGRGTGTASVSAAVGRCSSGLTWGVSGVGMLTGVPGTQRTMRFGSGITSGRMEGLKSNIQ